MSTKSCPVCAKPEAPDHAPFCGRACRDRDLLRWLGEGYLIPGPAADPEDVLRRVDSDDTGD